MAAYGGIMMNSLRDLLQVQVVVSAAAAACGRLQKQVDHVVVGNHLEPLAQVVGVGCGRGGCGGGGGGGWLNTALQ